LPFNRRQTKFIVELTSLKYIKLKFDMLPQDLYLCILKNATIKKEKKNRYMD